MCKNTFITKVRCMNLIRFAPFSLLFCVFPPTYTFFFPFAIPCSSSSCLLPRNTFCFTSRYIMFGLPLCRFPIASIFLILIPNQSLHFCIPINYTLPVMFSHVALKFPTLYYHSSLSVPNLLALFFQVGIVLLISMLICYTHTYTISQLEAINNVHVNNGLQNESV